MSLVANARAAFGGDRAGSRALAWHAIGSPLPFAHYGISTAAGTFRVQLETIRDRVVPLDLVSDGIALTFDDGYADFADTVLPLLLEMRLSATVFLTTAFVKQGRPLYLSLSDLRAIAGTPGLRIGSHGVTHCRLTGCDDQRLRSELRDSRHMLEEWSGQEVTAVAYPHGDVDLRVRDAAEEAGYRLGCTTRFGTNSPTRDRLLLCRAEIISSDSPRDFHNKAAGHWDDWGLRHRDAAAKGMR